MIGNDPYGYAKPRPSGMPTQYQDMPAKLFTNPDAGMYGDGGMKGPDPASMPGAPQMPQPYGGMADLDQMLQQRKAKEDHRQLMAQMLAGQQQQGPAPYANQGGPMQVAPLPVQTSPWTILTAGINGLMDGMKKGRQQQDPGGGGAGGAGGGSFSGGGPWS